MNSKLVTSLSLAAGLLCVSVSGDEVTDAIEEARQYYNSGDLSGAASQLDYASSLIRQKKAGTVVAVFPEPLEGWEAEEAESEAAGAMFMGGGITASRVYRKGDAEVKVSLVMDSPMLQSVVMMLNNPAMLTMSGGKLVKVQGNKGMLQTEGDRLTLSFVVNSNALITIEGWSGATKDDVAQYGETLNLKALE